VTDTGLNPIVIESVNEIMQRLRLDTEMLMRILDELRSENLQLKEQLRRPMLLVDIPPEGSLAQQLMDAANATGPDNHVMVSRMFLQYTAEQVQLAHSEYQRMQERATGGLLLAQKIIQELQ
jgi:hypothetical protein